MWSFFIEMSAVTWDHKKNMDSNLQKIVLQLSDKGLENKQNCAI